MHASPDSRDALIRHGFQLLTRLSDTIISLTEDEFDASAILAFDPEAELPFAIFARPVLSHDITHQVTGGQFDVTTWERLARASISEADTLDRSTCLALFLARRAVPESNDDAPIQPSLDPQVRILPRQRIDGDRFHQRCDGGSDRIPGCTDIRPGQVLPLSDPGL